MALTNDGLVLTGNALDTAVLFAQLHSSGTNPAANAIGTRVAVNGTVDGDGDVTWSNIAFTGLTANQPVSAVSFWTASTSGLCHSIIALTGDATANAAGAYTVTSATESNTSS